MGRISLLLALLVSLPALSSCNPLYMLFAPNVMRIESEETVLVQAHGITLNIDVEIHLFLFSDEKKSLYNTKTHLSEHNHLAAATVKIPADKLPKDARGDQYVSLRATSSVFTLHSVILISRQGGHIFIQTDKPIYTPTQTVLFRLLTVDNELKPSQKPTVVDFVNPQDIVAERSEVFMQGTSGISGRIFKIPEIVNIGMWKIVASYQHEPNITYTTQFEVKEYVLPNFEVTLESEQKFFYVTDTELNVTISARFTYGQPVEGRAFVLFGIIKDGKRLSLTKSLQTVAVVNGHGKAILRREHLTASNASFEDINSLVGSSIYVTASVITNTGIDLVETEKTGIKIVISPYTISFIKTSKYYKPGMPFDMMVYVTNPDGSPAKEVPVKLINGETQSKTQADGIAKLTTNSPGNAEHFHISVSTVVPGLPVDRQAHARMTAEPYLTQGGSKNYLHISIQQTELSPGDNLLVHLNYHTGNTETLEQIKYFTYMVINKGKIVDFGRKKKDKDQFLVTMQMQITPKLLPSFRLLVYYYVVKNSQVELVADSMWIDVKDSCMGTLKVSAANSIDNKKLYKPGEVFKIKLTGDPGARVGLVAVDKAVFTLSKKNMITQSKIWSVVEKNDIGCTPGSGRNVFGVFSDAGLAFVTNTDLKTETRTELKCKQPKQRKRRATELMEFKAAKLSMFTDESLRKCCSVGMKENRMGYSCTKRQQNIRHGKLCADAFLDCCEHIRKHMEHLRKSSLSLSRSADDDYTPFDDIVVRSQFPESWLWQMFTLPPTSDKNGHASKDITQYIKDSITTWEVQAVSISAGKGLCIAEPYELTVMKEFFIDLRLPYSAVRNEQVEIRANLYNYHPTPITVRVEFPYNEDLCSNAKPAVQYRQTITIPGKSSTVVPFIIVPLTIGEIPIEVRASVLNVFAGDGVRKSLRVVPEGVKTELPVKTYVLDPKDKAFNIDIQKPKDIIPNTKPWTLISAQGDILAETIENTIDALNLKHLFNAPSGCGEQNMASMTPVVIVAEYLDKSAQWPKVGMDLRATALKNIQLGYTQELYYRKEDGSYAAYLKRPSSTWLTAYVVKVFAMADKFIGVEANVLCGAVKWLILYKQKPDGHFIEDAPVMSGAMIGGLYQSQSNVPLTAFVLIALVEAKSGCSNLIQSYDNSIKKASDYLENHIDAIEKTYGGVLTAYALSLLGINKEEVVMKFASPDKSHWPVMGNADSLYTIEATGYALLFFLQQKQFDQTGKIVSWLSKRSEYGGGYSSTQATIVALQAMAKYKTDVPELKELDLNVVLDVPSRQRNIAWIVNTANMFKTKSLKLNSFEKFAVNVSGKGQGMLKVFTAYYALLPEENKECKNFNLNITITNFEKAKPREGVLNTLLLTICARYLSETPSSMVILDISMLTGFSPDLEDLDQLENEVENYISRFELDKTLSTTGSLIIYLDSVSNLEDTCIGFKVQQFYKVGLIQPASIKIYEYYDTTKSCTRFYNVPGNSAMLQKICEGDVCKCAEGSCVEVKTEKQKSAQRDDMSCGGKTDYVYKVTFVEKQKTRGYTEYTMKLLALIKQGTDSIVEGDQRQLILHVICDDKFRVEMNEDYLIMGESSDLWLNEKKVRYQIGANTWIERWPSDAECQQRKYQQQCQDLEIFAATLQIQGCGS